MKIVIRTPNWIGDSVLSLPVLFNLKEHSSKAQIWIAAHERVIELFSSVDFVKGIIPLSSLTDLKRMRNDAQKLKDFNFDIGLLLTNSFSSAFLFYMAKIPQRWGYARDGRRIFLTRSISIKNQESHPHQIYYYLELLSGLGIKTLPPNLNLSVSSHEKCQAERLFDSLKIDRNRPVILLNPGAFYGSAKRWPVSKYAELAILLQEKTGSEILILGSSTEAELAESIASPMKKTPVILTGKTSLPQLAAIISLGDLLITNDSGPMHIANALGIPVVALFGPTDPRITGPFQPPSTVIQKEVPCWPCSYRDCPYDHRCMMKIEPEEVYQACQNFLQ